MSDASVGWLHQPEMDAAAGRRVAAGVSGGVQVVVPRGVFAVGWRAG